MAVTVVSSFLGADIVGGVLDAEAAVDETSVVTVALVGGLGLLLSAAALVAWAAWLSRVVANVPAAGLGWPNVTPNAAVFESLIPGVNLYRVPAIVRDVTGRLEPDGKGDALIAAAWLALVGGALVPRIGRQVSALVVGEIEELSALWVVVGQLGLGMTVAGAALLIVLIRWIETRKEARAAGLEAPAVAPAAPPAAPTPST